MISFIPEIEIIMDVSPTTELPNSKLGFYCTCYPSGNIRKRYVGDGVKEVYADDYGQVRNGFVVGREEFAFKYGSLVKTTIYRNRDEKIKVMYMASGKVTEHYKVIDGEWKIVH
jgi:hypothetical protein